MDADAEPSRRYACRFYFECLAAGALENVPELACKGCHRYRLAAVEILTRADILPCVRLLLAIFEVEPDYGPEIRSLHRQGWTPGDIAGAVYGHRGTYYKRRVLGVLQGSKKGFVIHQKKFLSAQKELIVFENNKKIQEATPCRKKDTQTIRTGDQRELQTNAQGS